MVGKILNDVRTWSRFQKILIQLLIDYVLLSAAFLTAIALKFENVDYLLSGNIWRSLISASSAILFMHVLGTYRSSPGIVLLTLNISSAAVLGDLHLADFSGGRHQFARLGADSVWTLGHVSEHVATGHWLSLLSQSQRGREAIAIYDSRLRQL